jgi:hypothetical protein
MDKNQQEEHFMYEKKCLELSESLKPILEKFEIDTFIFICSVSKLDKDSGEVMFQPFIFSKEEKKNALPSLLGFAFMQKEELMELFRSSLGFAEECGEEIMDHVPSTPTVQ